MERDSRLPDPVVIGQDDQSELHVQAVVQSGRRHLDIRMWRRAPSGFAPSRTGITLAAGDLHALQQGIAELLQASDGGKQVARVVWDGEDGRRLRAETEPFGTRYVAKLGFWQRVRDRWKPVDDGLVLAADRLKPLQNALQRFVPWMQATDGEERQVAVAPRRPNLDHWPAPGADWLTVEPDRIAFHPRGVRLTCTVTEHDGQHRLEIRQWRREDTLWLPEPVAIALTITDLDRMLSHLLQLADADRGTTPAPAETIPCADSSMLRVSIVGEATQPVLRIEYQLPARPELPTHFEPRISLPTEYLPRFGRALAQGWFLLAGWLSETERTTLQQPEEPAPPARAAGVGVGAYPPVGAPREGALPPAATPQAEERAPQEAEAVVAAAPIGGPPPSPVEGARPLTTGQVFSFGAESETPGTVIPGQEEVRVIVEGFMLPRGITLPIEVVAKVITGLDELNVLRRTQARVNPVLLCDRPDCAVYGRVGTNVRPDGVELRVWTGPTTSDSISFEAIYLPDLIDGLRQSLRLLGRPAPPTVAAADVPAIPPAPVPQPSSPARMRPIAAATPLEAPGPIAAPGESPAAIAPLSISLGTLTLGHSLVSLSIQGHRDNPGLHLQWESNSLELPVRDLEELLSDVRGLYYDTLRGRRGRSLSVGEYPVVTISVQHQGTQLYCMLDQEIDGEITSLRFPASEVPTFLNAARAALSRW